MLIVDTRLPKLCHARVGSVVSIQNEISLEPEFYLVCVVPKSRKVNNKPAWRGGFGLYSEEKPLFLVNLQTGEALEMPHLSSRVEILEKASMHIGEK